MLSNFLSASDLIIQRLIDEQVADSNKVRAAPSSDWVTGYAHGGRWVPGNALDGSVSVIFFDDQPIVTPGGQSMRGKTQTSEQFWQIIVSAKNVADAGISARQDAGVILGQVLVALQGWPPSPQHTELHRQKSPFRATDRDGFVHLPVMFSTKTVITGSAVPR